MVFTLKSRSEKKVVIINNNNSFSTDLGTYMQYKEIEESRKSHQTCASFYLKRLDFMKYWIVTIYIEIL